MEIAELGEFGLISQLTKDIKPENGSTEKGVGDDCAVLNYGGERRVLVTTDMLMEGIHFDLQYVPLKHLGYKSSMVNLSDIYAMNGTPRQVTVSLAISKRFQVEDIEELYSGMRLACEQHHVDLVGGDTTASVTGLAISVTAIGEAKAEDIVYRSGAQPNDLICVSGNLGAAYMGLQLMERERTVFNSQVHELQKKIAEAKEKGNEELAANFSSQLANLDFQPEWSGREYLLERQLRPEARIDIVEELRKAGIKPTAMMDISDGLSSELFHICTQSKVGCDIYEDKLPVDYQSAALADEMNLNVVTCALNGGEDYELLFTCDIHDYEKLVPIDDIYIIGHITEGNALRLIPRTGEPFPLTAQGWNAFEQ